MNTSAVEFIGSSPGRDFFTLFADFHFFFVILNANYSSSIPIFFLPFNFPCCQFFFIHVRLYILRGCVTEPILPVSTSAFSLASSIPTSATAVYLQFAYKSTWITCNVQVNCTRVRFKSKYLWMMTPMNLKSHLKKRGKRKKEENINFCSI